MKKGIRILAAILLLFCVNPLYSQFYDIKKKKRIASISTVTENAANAVFSKEETSASEAVQEEKKEDGLKVEEGLFSPPLDTLVVTSGYGYRNDPITGKRKFHYGTDFAGNSDNVYAMMPGRIKKIDYNKKLGNYIVLDHGEFRVTYAHLHTVIGDKGDFVQAGQSVGITGSTGRSTGEHLHLAIRYKNKSVDPYPLVKYIRDWSRSILDSTATAALPIKEKEE